MEDIKAKQILNLFFLIVVITFFLNVVSALTYPQGENLTLTFSCSQLDGNCSVSQNITIIYPNSTIAVNNQETTIQNGFVNYTLDSSISQTIGEYIAYINNQEFFFEITPTGESPSTSGSLIYLTIIILLLFIQAIVFYAHMGDKGFVWKFFWFSITWILQIVIFFTSWQLTADFGSTAFNFLSTFFYIIFIILIVAFPFYLLILVLIVFAMVFIWLFKVLPLKQRGMTTEESWGHIKSRNSGNLLGKWLNLVDVGGR